MSKCNTLFWLILLQVLCSWVLAASPASDNPRIVLQLRWHHQFQFAGYYAAVAKGFYAAEGLNVEIREGDPAHQPVAEVLSGHAQYAEGNSEVLYQRLLGKPLVALAAIFQHSPSVLLTRQDSAISSVHDLLGKRVMLMNQTEDADFLAMFLSEGIALDKLQIIPSSYNLDDFVTGKVDAFNSYATNEPFLLQQQGIAYNVIDPSNYHIDFYSDILFTNEAELHAHPQRVEAMRRASLKGWRYAMDHPEEIINLLLEHYPVEKSREHLQFEASTMRKLIFPDLIEIGHMNPGRWQHMADTFVKAGLIKPNYSLDGFIYDPTPKHLPAWVLPVLAGVIGILGIVSFVTYSLHRLNLSIMQAKDTLKQSEERLRLALGAANQSWFDVQLPTGKVLVSDEYARILGYEPQEFESSLSEWQSKLHPDDIDIVMSAFRECMLNGGPTSMEYRRLKKNGDWVWLNSVGKITEWGADHQALRMIGIHTDITERKRGEELLAETRLQYSSLLSTIPVGVYKTDTEGKCTYVNNRWSDITGLSLQASQGDSWIKTIHPEDQVQVLTQWQAFVTHQQAFNVEYRFVHPNQKVTWVLGQASVLYSRSGEFIGFTGTITDITERKQLQELLEQKEQHLRAILDTTSECVKLVAADGKIISINRSGLDLAEASQEQDILNQSFYRLIAPEYHEAYRAFNADICAGKSGQLQFEIITFKGHRLWMETHAVPFISKPNGAVLQLAFTQEITARKQAEIHSQLAASVFTHAREGILITNAEGTIIEVNATFTQISGYSRAEAIGQNPRILQSGRHDKAFYQALWQDLLENDYWSGEIWNKHKDGKIYAEMITISAVKDVSGHTQNYVGLFTDITPMKDHQKQLERIAHYDALTGLPNRVLLADRLHQSMFQSERRKQSLVVAYLDLDGFKQINDTFGHEIGDTLLITVSQRMKEALRDGDTLARIGGDEFVAVLVDLDDAENSTPVLERLLQAASDPIVVNETLLRVSASIGATFYPQDGADADQLIRHADQAMYIAKQSGKNCYHLFDVNHDTAVKIQRESVEHIRRGLEQEEFILYYQPKVQMQTGQVIGVEALIRWQNPERGLLLPADFLPVIENHQISLEVGAWVIESALQQIASWHQQGLLLPISVNVGASLLLQTDFALHLQQLLLKYPQVSANCLELEILETSALGDIAEVSLIMDACRALGVRFALDDFGTGYSSLTYLKRLPADILKIDQSFVRDMLDDPDDLAIVNAVIGLSTFFRRQVIAEGVETLAQGTQLLQLGCVLAQGFGIARPMPASAIPGWMEQWQKDKLWQK